jgi:hypothetical protein
VLRLTQRALSPPPLPPSTPTPTLLSTLAAPTTPLPLTPDHAAALLRSAADALGAPDNVPDATTPEGGGVPEVVCVEGDGGDGGGGSGSAARTACVLQLIAKLLCANNGGVNVSVTRVAAASVSAQEHYDKDRHRQCHSDGHDDEVEKRHGGWRRRVLAEPSAATTAPGPPVSPGAPATRAEAVRATAESHVEAAAALARSAQWSAVATTTAAAAAVVFVEEVFELAHASVRVLATLAAAYVRTPAFSPLACDVVAQLLELVEECAGSAWLLEPSCASLARAALGEMECLLTLGVPLVVAPGTGLAAVAAECLPRLRALMLACAATAPIPTAAVCSSSAMSSGVLAGDGCAQVGALLERGSATVAAVAAALWAHGSSAAVTAFVYSLGAVVVAGDGGPQVRARSNVCVAPTQRVPICSMALHSSLSIPSLTR